MNFEQALDDLDGIERIWIIYLFHLNQKNWKLPKKNANAKPNIQWKNILKKIIPGGILELILLRKKN